MQPLDVDAERAERTLHLRNVIVVVFGDRCIRNEHRVRSDACQEIADVFRCMLEIAQALGLGVAEQQQWHDRPHLPRIMPRVQHCALRCSKAESPATVAGLVLLGCLTMTYFRTGNPHYHRRAAVSRSCSGWEGVGPAG